mmetsp:Transcript_14427/g.35161  ORF Transcript_14427/g.35161 Transcript_14427/m.35161 type:complete len:220 (-) Transcript_14427:13-672(-)
MDVLHDVAMHDDDGFVLDGEKVWGAPAKSSLVQLVRKRMLPEVLVLILLGDLPTGGSVRIHHQAGREAALGSGPLSRPFVLPWGIVESGPRDGRRRRRADALLQVGGAGDGRDRRGGGLGRQERGGVHERRGGEQVGLALRCRVCPGVSSLVLGDLQDLLVLHLLWVVLAGDIIRGEPVEHRLVRFPLGILLVRPNPEGQRLPFQGLCERLRGIERDQR